MITSYWTFKTVSLDKDHIFHLKDGSWMRARYVENGWDSGVIVRLNKGRNYFIPLYEERDVVGDWQGSIRIKNRIIWVTEEDENTIRLSTCIVEKW